jgi:DNA-binding IclR family transcriptional regulator
MASKPAADGEDGANLAVVKSAGRALEILELFSRARRHLGASEIGQALGYPKSSTNALLRSLVSLGYLVLNSRTLRYFPSLSVTKLGDWIPSVVLSSGDVLEILTEVHEATQETVTLTVQNDLSVNFLRVLPGTFPISLRMKEGFMASLFTTAVGHAILAQMADDEIGTLVGRANARARRGTARVDLDRVLRSAADTRRKGFAVLYDALFPDTGALAVPLPAAVEGFPMAIGVGGLRERIRRNEAAIYRAMQASVTRHLGARQQRRRAAAQPRS